MAATVKDVALRAGVSVATVSKYMNGGKLRESYRKSVEQAVEELGYSINEIARNLKIKRTYIIGVLASSIRSTFIATIISALQCSLLDKGYSTVIVDYQCDKDLEAKQVEVLLRRQVDGVIIFPAENEIGIIEVVKTRGIPVMLLDNILEDYPCNAVVTDNRDCSERVTRRLIELGHRNITICAGPKYMYTAKERLAGYLSAIETSGLKPSVILGEYETQTAFDALVNMAKSREKPTAIISSSYYTALGALRALNELSWRIPDDVSFVTFDDLEFNCALSPQISTVIQPLEEIGLCAAEKIVSLVENGQSGDPCITTLKSKIQYTSSIRPI